MFETEIKAYIEKNLTIGIKLDNKFYSSNIEVTLKWEGEAKPFSSDSINLDEIVKRD